MSGMKKIEITLPEKLYKETLRTLEGSKMSLNDFIRNALVLHIDPKKEAPLPAETFYIFDLVFRASIEQLLHMLNNQLPVNKRVKPKETVDLFYRQALSERLSGKNQGGILK